MLGGFTFRSPREIVFGPGARTRLPESIRHFGTRVSVIIGQTWFEQEGWNDELDSILDGFEVSCARCPAGEPTTCAVVDPEMTLVLPTMITGMSGTDASYGALISALALADAGLGAAHGFASGLGGSFNSPHGPICASCIGPVLEANASVIRDPVEWLVGEVTELLGAFGLEGAIREYSVPKERFAEIAERPSGSSMSGNPRELSLTERERLLARVLG